MDDYRNNKPRAVAIADQLLRRSGAAAFGHATDRRQAAVMAGHTARADLFLAVCTILADRDRVFTRLKLRS